VLLKEIIPIPKYDIMKAHRRSGGKVPCILNLGIRWRLVFMLHVLATQLTGNESLVACPLNMRLGGPQSQSGCGGED
jgi:hypothetical protein